MHGLHLRGVERGRGKSGLRHARLPREKGADDSQAIAQAGAKTVGFCGIHVIAIYQSRVTVVPDRVSQRSEWTSTLSFKR